MTHPTENGDQCTGCGKAFAGERGLRAHQAARFVAMACKARTEHLADPMRAIATVIEVRVLS